MTTAGDLTRRLRFESPAPTRNALNEVEDGWQEEFTVAAEVFSRMGSETILAARLTGVQPVEITVRRSLATRRITAAWRAVDVHSGEVFAIASPAADPDGSRAWLKMMGRAGVAA